MTRPQEAATGPEHSAHKLSSGWLQCCQFERLCKVLLVNNSGRLAPMCTTLHCSVVNPHPPPCCSKIFVKLTKMQNKHPSGKFAFFGRLSLSPSPPGGFVSLAVDCVGSGRNNNRRGVKQQFNHVEDCPPRAVEERGIQ